MLTANTGGFEKKLLPFSHKGNCSYLGFIETEIGLFY